MKVQCLLRSKLGESYMVSWLDLNLAKEGAQVELIEDKCILGIYEIVHIYAPAVSNKWFKDKQKADRKGLPSIQKADRDFNS